MLYKKIQRKKPFGRFLSLLLLLATATIVLPVAGASRVFDGEGNVFEGGQVFTSGNVGKREYRTTHYLGNGSGGSSGDGSDTGGSSGGQSSDGPNTNRTSLGVCVLDREYEFTFLVSGGTPPYNWKITSGTLPKGITFDSSAGTLSGRPVEGGLYPIKVKVTDSSDPALSDEESFQLGVTMYEYLVPVYGLDVAETYIANYGPGKPNLYFILNDAESDWVWSEIVAIDENSVIKASDIFDDFGPGKVMNIYSDNYLSVIDVRYSSDRQTAWKYTCLPTTQSAGDEFLFALRGWSTSAVCIANADLNYRDATVNIEVCDSDGKNCKSYQVVIPPYQMRNTFDLFGNLFEDYSEAIVKITCDDNEVVVHAGSWNAGGGGGWGREILPLNKSRGRFFRFHTEGFDNASAEILNVSDDTNALVDITVHNADGTTAENGEFKGIIIPAGSSVSTADITGLENIYALAYPAVVTIESTNEVDIVVHNSSWSGGSAGIEFSSRAKEYAAGTSFFFSAAGLTHSRFSIANAGPGEALVDVTIRDGDGNNPEIFSIEIQPNGMVNSYDFIPGDIYNVHKPAVISIESKNGRPLLVHSIASFDALTESSIEACGTTIYPVSFAGEFRITGIERDENNDDMILTFQSIEGAEYNVFYSEDDLSEDMAWLIAASGLEGSDSDISYRDDGSGTVTHPVDSDKRFYKIEINGTDRTSGNIVGVCKIHIEIGRNLVSSPLIPFEGRLDLLIGDQLTGSDFNKNFSDTIERWNRTTEQYDRAYLKLSDGEWKDWNTGGSPIFVINADEGYWINIHPLHEEKDILLVGEVSRFDRKIELKHGANLVGSSYPVSVSLDDSGLLESGFSGSGDRTLSDLIQWWNSGIGAYETIYYNSDTSQWTNWDGTHATRTFEPGLGFWITILDFNEEFDWILPKPY